jgi:hypothetical protein
MDPGVPLQLETIVRNRAVALQKDLMTLRVDLAPVFPVYSSQPEPAVPEVHIESPVDLIGSVNRLRQLCISLDDRVNRTFSVSVERPDPPPVNTSEFWIQLSNTESLLAELIRSGHVTISGAR